MVSDPLDELTAAPDIISGGGEDFSACYDFNMAQSPGSPETQACSPIGVPGGPETITALPLSYPPPASGSPPGTSSR